MLLRVLCVQVFRDSQYIIINDDLWTPVPPHAAAITLTYNQVDGKSDETVTEAGLPPLAKVKESRPIIVYYGFHATKILKIYNYNNDDNKNKVVVK